MSNAEQSFEFNDNFSTVNCTIETERIHRVKPALNPPLCSEKSASLDFRFSVEEILDLHTPLQQIDKQTIVNSTSGPDFGIVPPMSTSRSFLRERKKS